MDGTLNAATKIDTDFAEEFSLFAVSISCADLPSNVVDAAKNNLRDTLTCAIAGISAAGVSEVVDLAVGWGGREDASIFCTPYRVPAHHAAWVNGMMCHARDFDDTHDKAVLHAGVSVIPAAIAAAELDPAATGDDLLAGIVAGLELICRLGRATTVGIIESGYMYTSLFGHFAATAAASRVLRFDARQTQNALGIAYSQAAGTHQVTRDAALTKRMQPGFAAKTGLLSTALTKAGIRGVYRPFEGVDGLFNSYLKGEYDASRLRGGLGSSFELLELSYKPYPCCRFNHGAIDAAIALRAQMGGDLSDIRQIRVYLNRQAFEAVCTPLEMRRSPATVVQAQFSVPYTVARALLDGTVEIGDFDEQRFRDSQVLAIAAKVVPQIDEEIERSSSRGVSPVRIVVETGRGEFSAYAAAPKGGADAPMTEEDWERKAKGCLAASGIAWGPDTYERLRETIDRANTLSSGSAVIRCLQRN